MPPDQQQTIRRILKVNHAGEHGAIRIYGAQMLVSQWLFPSLMPKLKELRGHEIEHWRLFAEAMTTRNARQCRALFLWAWGGAAMGFVTALLGPRMIWICTEAVESAVHHHLSDQLAYLESRDSALSRVIASIQAEELSHLELAIKGRGKATILSWLSCGTISWVTDVLIWMSTSGDSLRLRMQLKAQTHGR